MKILLDPRMRQRGSVLVVTLIITFIVGVTLASYLIMTSGQNLSVVRSQTWNSAFALTEAGVEDALAMMNKYNGNFEMLPYWTNYASLTADHWATLNPGVYHARRFIGADFYDVYITNFNNRPTIRSIGTIAWAPSYASAQQGFLAVAGVSGQFGRTQLSRTVDVRTKVDPIFNFAMAAINLIDLNGKNVSTDSFDSSNTNYSTGGVYDKNKAKDEGDVVTNDIITGALNVGNAKIKGVVKTGPEGTVDIGPNGSVGDNAWVTGGNHGVQDGHFADDMNVVWDPVILPSTSWLAVAGNASVLANYATNGTTYSYAFMQSGDYFLSGSSITKGLYVGPNVNVRLHVYTGDVNLVGGNDEIRISSNSTLKIYMAGPSFSIGGKGVVNQSGNAANFEYYGLPGNTELNYNANASFTGAIYAPNAVFTLGGGGNDTYDFVGASVSKSVKMSGHFRFHYDENLRNIGPGRGYILTDWKES